MDRFNGAESRFNLFRRSVQSYLLFQWCYSLIYLFFWDGVGGSGGNWKPPTSAAAAAVCQVDINPKWEGGGVFLGKNLSLSLYLSLSLAR